MGGCGHRAVAVHQLKGDVMLSFINTDSIRIIRAEKCADEKFPDKLSYKIRITNTDGMSHDVKCFRDKQSAQNFLDEIAEEITNKDANHVVIINQL